MVLLSQTGNAVQYSCQPPWKEMYHSYYTHITFVHTVD